MKKNAVIKGVLGYNIKILTLNIHATERGEKNDYHGINTR